MRWISPLLICALFTGCAAMGTAETPPNKTEASREAEDRPASTPGAAPRYDDGGPIAEARLEPAELRIQRQGRIQICVKGKEIRASREIRRAAARFNAVVMGFKDTEVSLKMPSAALDAFIDFLDSQDGMEVEEYDFSAFDRTMEHYSVEEQLELVQATFDRLRELEKTAPSLAELERIGAKIAEVGKTLKALKTQQLDLKLHAGRVDIRIEIR